MARKGGARAPDEQAKKRKLESTEDGVRVKRHRADESSLRDDKMVTNTFSPEKPVQNAEVSIMGAWDLSKVPMGGRMMDIDPIITPNEKYLVLAYNSSIQVYSAADSLLVRRIDICSPGETVTAMRLAPNDPNLLFVAVSTGNIFRATIQGSERPYNTKLFRTKSKTAHAICAHQTSAGGRESQVILVAESDRSSRLELVAYQSAEERFGKPQGMLNLKKSGNGLRILEASDDGSYFVGALSDRLFFGVTPAASDEDSDGKYEVYSFDAPDIITSVDIRVHGRGAGLGKRKGAAEAEPVVDIIVGGARGSIYRYSDALARLRTADKEPGQKDMMQAQAYHWHRKAVHAVKWSRDGNYMISGGSENVLVIWQMDTGKTNYLPHLSGSIENITVSPSGSAYAVHLDDNSAMILSTAELIPTAYVSGLQSAVANLSTPKDMLVKRVWSSPQHVTQPIPAVLDPVNPSKLHVCVGNGRQATLAGGFSTPLLQTFDLESFVSTTTQALARTHPTDFNTSSKGFPLDEPQVSHIAFSHDGKWLASIDDWGPVERDAETLTGDLKEQFLQERHETHLKFWQTSGGDEPAALVSRIDNPHPSGHKQSTLDLASSPTSACFATIGSDGLVKLWRPRPRQQGGVEVKSQTGGDLFTWTCSQIIAIADGQGQEAGYEVAPVGEAMAVLSRPQGRVTFSEDGSSIFAAYGAVDAGAAVVIDAASGAITQSLDGLWTGDLRGLQALDSYLVVLSDELRIYDVVSDELRYGIVIPKVVGVRDLLQLAVDHVSGNIAIAMPVGNESIVGIFSPDDAQPLATLKLSRRTVSLLSSPVTSGFIALDDAAQVWTMTQRSRSSTIRTGQPLENLQLNGVEAEVESRSIIEADEERAHVESDEDMEMDELDSDDMDVEDSSYPQVIPQQRLADIFEAVPAFAAPSVEDMFYKVASLLATKPLVQS